MTESPTILLAQIESGAADPAANAAAIRRLHAAAEADLVLTPGGSVAGGLPGDLVRDADFRAACDAAIAGLAAQTAGGGPGLVVGGPWLEGGRLHDALFLLEGGRIAARRARHLVAPGEPFDPGPAPGPVAFRGARLGLTAGEDALDPGVAETLAETGAEVMLCLAADPFAPGRAPGRMQQAVARVVETGLGLVVLNAVGGPDEAVCDGGSFVLNPDRSLAAQLPRFEGAVLVTRWRRGSEGLACDPLPPAPDCGGPEELWRALVLGLRGLAGPRAGLLVGLDGEAGPAIAAVLAVDALGPERVQAVLLPGLATPAADIQGAEALARHLGIGFEALPIGPAVAAMAGALGADGPEGLPALERALRAAALRAIAARRGMRVLSGRDGTALRLGQGAGEGDLAPLKDLWRGEALALARWRNVTRPEGLRAPPGPLLPDALLDRRPAWLDGVPADPALDAVLEGLSGSGLGVADLAAAGHDRVAVDRLRRRLAHGEAAWRRAPPGVRIRPRPEGRDRRYPLANLFTDPDA